MSVSQRILQSSFDPPTKRMYAYIHTYRYMYLVRRKKSCQQYNIIRTYRLRILKNKQDYKHSGCRRQQSSDKDTKQATRSLSYLWFQAYLVSYPPDTLSSSANS